MDQYTNQSVRTIKDKSINTTVDGNDNFNKQGRQYLIVQVSVKLTEEEIDLDDDELLENIAGVSTKFITH